MLRLVTPVAAIADDSIWTSVSDPGLAVLVVAATATPLLADDADSREQLLRTADTVICTYLLSAGLKRVISEPRPDGSGDDSFPSNHASIAFAAAAAASSNNPDQAPYWYAAAGLVAYSRVELKQHRKREVIAGALLGYLTSELEHALPRGLLVYPLLDADGTAGVQALWEF